MAPIVGNPPLTPEGKSLLGSDNPLTSGLFDNESNINDLIVTTLYAKPSTSRPLLTISDLKRGVYKESSYLSLKGFILYSDIGAAARNAALGVNKNTAVQLVKTSMLEEDKQWQVMIKNPDLICLVNSNRFKPIGNYTSSFYISLEVCSEPGPLMTFVSGIMESLNRKPWESENGELDWGKFLKKTSTPKSDVIEQWALLSNSPKLATGIARQQFELICSRCNKSLEIEWILCPFCGERIKDQR